MPCISVRRLTLLMSVVACALFATTVHAQTQPGSTNGGLTVTLSPTGGVATTMAVAGTHAEPSTPVTPGFWLQALALPSWQSWPTLLVRVEPVRKPARDRRTVGTR